MIPRTVLSLFFAGLAAIAARAEASLQDKIAGTWKATDTSRFEEAWTFTFAEGSWEVKGVYLKNGREAGTAHGTKIKAMKDGLLFTRVFDKKPAADYGDEATGLFKLTESGGELVFKAGKKTSVRELKRDDKADVAKPDSKPKPKGTEPKEDATPVSMSGFTEVGQLRASKSIAGLSVGLSPDGKRASLTSTVLGTSTNTVAIWDFAEKKVVQRIKPAGLTNRLVWSADGKWIATLQLNVGAPDAKPAQLAVWDAETAEQRASFDLPPFASALAMNADGSVIAAVSGGDLEKPGRLVAWDVATKKELLSVEVKSSIPSISLSADGKSVLAVGYGPKFDQLAVLDVKSGKPRATLKAGSDRVIMSPDARQVVYVGYGGGQFSLNVWDVTAPNKAPRSIAGAKWRADAIALVDNNRQVLVAGSYDEVQVIELASGKVTHSFVPVKKLASITLTTTPDSSHALILCGDFTARLYSTPFRMKK